MTVISHILATGVAILSGFGLLSLLRRPGIARRGPGELIALSYLVGIMLIAFEMWLLGRLGVSPGVKGLLLLQVLPLGLLVLALVRRRDRVVAGRKIVSRLSLPSGWWQWLLVALIASKLVFVLTMNLNELLRPNDAFKSALVLARYTFFEGNYTTFELPAGYPALPGLVLYWFGGMSGGWSEFAANLAHFNYYAAFLLLYYANLRECAGRSWGLVGTYILSALPLLLVHAALVGYADLPMGIFLTFAGAYAYRYARGGRGDDLAIACFFALCLPAIKLEGKVPYFPIALYALLAAVCQRRGLSRPRTLWALAGGILTVCFLSLWYLLARYGIAGPPWLADAWANIIPGNRWDQIGEPLLRHFGHFYNQWMVIGTLVAIVFPFAALRFAGRCEYVLGLYGSLLLVSFAYLYCVGGAYLWLANGTVVNRSYLQILPVLLFGTIVMFELWLRSPLPERPPAPSSPPPRRP